MNQLKSTRVGNKRKPGSLSIAIQVAMKDRPRVGEAGNLEGAGSLVLPVRPVDFAGNRKTSCSGDCWNRALFLQLALNPLVSVFQALFERHLGFPLQNLT
jgi:hypothetical protein